MFRKTISIIIGMLLVFGVFGCATRVAELRLLYSSPPSDLYSQMILTLQDLGWVMTHTDKDSLTILAQKEMSSEMAIAATSGGEAKPYHASINFRKQNGKTSLSIAITQPGGMFRPGGILTAGTPKKLRNEIIEAFQKRVGQGIEVVPDTDVSEPESDTDDSSEYEEEIDLIY